MVAFLAGEGAAPTIILPADFALSPDPGRLEPKDTSLLFAFPQKADLPLLRVPNVEEAHPISLKRVASIPAIARLSDATTSYGNLLLGVHQLP